MAPQRAMDATGARYLSSARRGRQIDRQTPRQHFKNAPPNSPKRQLLFLHLAQWANTDRSRNHPCPRSPPPPISPACLFCAMHLSCGDTSYSRADGGVTLLSIGRPRAGIPQTSPTTPTRVSMPAQAAGAPPQPPRYTMMDVKTLSGANELYHEGPHARQRRRGVLGLSGAVEHAGGASRVSFADPNRRFFRAPHGALRAAARGALRPDRGHGGHVRSSPTQRVCDGGPGSRGAPGGGRVAEQNPR